MRGAIPLGRAAGIPVAAHWSALVGVGLLAVLLASSVLPALTPVQPRWAYWLAAAVAAAALVGSLLAHELAHALVARRRGVGVRRITLWLLGGVSELVEQPAEPGSEARIAFVGPATSLALGALLAAVAVVAAAAGSPALLTATLSWLVTMNVVLGVFNLLPGTPLDGGRILHAVLWWRTGDSGRATRAASTAGSVMGALLAGLGVLLALEGRLDGLWLILLGWFLAGAAATETRADRALAALGALRASDVMSPATTAAGWWTVQAFVAHLLAPDGPRHRVFPVVEADGGLTGVVSVADLAACPHADRRTVPLRRLARPLPPGLLLAPDTPLATLLRVPFGADAMAVVTSAGQVIGVLTAADLQRAVEIGALVAKPVATPG